MSAESSLPTNEPFWAALPQARREGFQEVWYLKLNDPSGQRALWLRFLLLSSANGFRRVAETWAVYFHRRDNREVSKVVVRQSHDLGAFQAGGGSIRIGDCHLGPGETRGHAQAKGNSVRWDLKFMAPEPSSFTLIPDRLNRFGLVKNRIFTISEDLRFSGTTEINGETIQWKDAPGMQGHLAGPRSGHSWVWGHCNAFTDEQGRPAPFVFEGLTAQAKLLGPIRSPRMSSFYFRYQGQEYRFNSLWDAVSSRSETSLNQWQFRVERGDLVFAGEARAEFRDFAGMTFEDTDGSLLYCANSKLSDMKVLVYRRGKLEATLTAPGTAAFEVVGRSKNPYVPLLI